MVVWVRLPYLLFEYYQSNLLFRIVNLIGKTLKVDHTTEMADKTYPTFHRNPRVGLTSKKIPIEIFKEDLAESPLYYVLLKNLFHLQKSTYIVHSIFSTQQSTTDAQRGSLTHARR